MNIKDAYIHNGDAILKDIQLSGSKLQKLKAGKNADDTYLTWVDVLDLSPFGASGHNHDDRYLKLSGGTLALGEGLKFHADENYFGTNLDARIISLLDGNGTTCDGGLIIDERATSNGVEHITELLRIRDSEFKWKGNDIYHTNNLSIKTLMGSTAIGDSDEPVYWNGSSFVKAGAYPTKASWNYDDMYLKLAGGTMSNTNVVTNLNADLLDGYHKNDILRKTEDPTSVISLNNVVTNGIDFTSWGFAHSANINNQPWGNGASSAASVVSFGTAFPFQIYSDYNDTSYLYYRSCYRNNGIY